MDRQRAEKEYKVKNFSEKKSTLKYVAINAWNSAWREFHAFLL
jgi:hypothetical protein